MTRINVVPPQELHQKHLVAEYREIVRVFALVRNRLKSNTLDKVTIPSEYILGAGHVTFFFNKLEYIKNRYRQLIQEMVHRGYSPNPIQEAALCAEIDSRFFGDYTPTEKALEINRSRIKDRQPK